MAKENNATCPKCDKDVALDKFTDGRCPECGFNMQLYIDRRQVREVEEKERKAEREKNPPPEEKKKKSGLTGFGI